MSSSSHPSFYRQNQASMSNSSTTPSRPRFAFYGPAPYPRPRSSASKPNPSPHYDYPVGCSTPLEESSYHSGHMYPPDTSYSVDRNASHASTNFNTPIGKPCLLENRSSSSYDTCLESPYNSEHCIQGVDSFTGNQSISNYNQNYDLPGHIPQRATMEQYQQTSGQWTPQAPLAVEQPFQPASTWNDNGDSSKKFSRKRKAPSSSSQLTKHCELCNLEFTSQIPLDMHLRGAKHMKKLKAQETMKMLQTQGYVESTSMFHCAVCEKTLNSALQLQTHYEGSKHKTKLAALAEGDGETEEKTDEPSEQNGEGVNEKPLKLFDCKICDVIMNSENQLVMHMNGTKHQNKLDSMMQASTDSTEQAPAKMAKLGCDVCGISVNSQTQLQQHLDSKKHLAKITGQQPERSGKAKESPPATSEEGKCKEVKSIILPLSSSFVQAQDAEVQ